jgi:hypothetical protein
MTKSKRQPPPGLKPQAAAKPLRTTKVGSRVLVFYDSVLEVLGIDPATEPADRPKTVTIKQTENLIGLGERAIFRMIAAGRAADNQQDTAA